MVVWDQYMMEEGKLLTSTSPWQLNKDEGGDVDVVVTS